jgi:hypothetical protein
VPADPASFLESRADADDDTEITQLLARFSCERCGMTFWFPVSTCIVNRPAVVSFSNDHGVDIRAHDYLELSFVGGSGGTLVSEDPVRITIGVGLGDDTLLLTLNETLTVVDVDRVDG